MRRNKLRSNWFARPALLVASDLVGKILVRSLPSGVFRYRITETEAYCGVKDLACHASKGRTKRTEVMFGSAGRIYVYLIYGMYYCLNFVTAQTEKAEAVLIRAVEPLFITNQKPIGPGKLCRVLLIDKTLNNKIIGQTSGLWVEDDGYVVTPKQLGKSARRGIIYAQKYALKPWRFYLKSSLFVS